MRNPDLENKVFAIVRENPEIHLMTVIQKTRANPGAVMLSLAMLSKAGYISETSPNQWRVSP